MLNREDKTSYELGIVVVNYGLGSKILKIARNCGVSGGTILLGKGTIKNNILEFLELNDIKKEIVLLLCERSIIHQSLEELSRKLKFEKPNHGIAFSIPVSNILGARNCNCDNIEESRGVVDKMYEAIFTIIDRGKAESVVDAAVLAGSKGGTIINARGSGIHEKSKLFSMIIEPEKEIVMIISHKDNTNNIVSTIREKLEIDRPGNGIIFVLDISKAYGLIK